MCVYIYIYIYIIVYNTHTHTHTRTHARERSRPTNLILLRMDPYGKTIQTYESAHRSLQEPFRNMYIALI